MKARSRCLCVVWYYRKEGELLLLALCIQIFLSGGEGLQPPTRAFVPLFLVSVFVSLFACSSLLSLEPLVLRLRLF